MPSVEPKGPLQSDLLRVNERLQRCAVFDIAHVEPREPESDHVRLIQEALRKTVGADIPSTEKGYEDATIKAVVDFKSKNNLFTRGTQTVDPIVGTGTIRKLDALMKQVEDRSSGNQKAAKVIPKLSLSGQCQVIGEFPDNPAAEDMKTANPISARKSGVTIAITTPFVLLSDSTLETTMQGSMITAATIAGGGKTSIISEGVNLVSHFFTGGGGARDFPKGSAMSNEATTDVGFINFASKVQFAVDPVVRTAWKAGLVDDRAIAATLRPTLDAAAFGTGQFGGGLAAFIGGFQGYHIELCGFTPDTAAETFTYKLDIQIFDHFGVDDSDINRQSGAIGSAIGTAMAAFFVLQHDRNEGGANRRANKYRPFRITLRADMGPFTGRVF